MPDRIIFGKTHRCKNPDPSGVSMVKANDKKIISSESTSLDGSKKTALKTVSTTAGAKSKTDGKNAIVEKSDLTDSVDNQKTAKKAASKKKAAAKKAASKKTTAKKPATSKVSSSKTASKATAKEAAKASAAPDNTATSANPSATTTAAEENVAKKALQEVENQDNMVDAENDQDEDFEGDLPSGLSKAPVPYERVAGHYMDAEQLVYFSKKLAEWKQQLMEEVDRTVGHMKDDATNFPDPNDRATQEEEFSLELRTRDRERKLIKKINEAQKRIDDDEYGYCETCGIEIGVNRLEARPTAELCIDCKTLEEIRERQNA